LSALNDNMFTHQAFGLKGIARFESIDDRVMLLERSAQAVAAAKLEALIGAEAIARRDGLLEKKVVVAGAMNRVMECGVRKAIGFMVAFVERDAALFVRLENFLDFFGAGAGSGESRACAFENCQQVVHIDKLCNAQTRNNSAAMCADAYESFRCQKAKGLAHGRS